MSWTRGKLADHVEDDVVLSPEGVVLVTSPGTESSYARPPQSLKHSFLFRKVNVYLSSFAPEKLVSRNGFGSPVPRQPGHLLTRAGYDAYLRDSSRVPRRRPFIYLNRHTLSSQSQVYWVPQLRTDDIHCRESTDTGPENLKVAPNGCCLVNIYISLYIYIYIIYIWSPWTNEKAPLFPTHTIGMKWACCKVPANLVP